MSFDTVTFWVFFVAAWAIWRGLPFNWAKSATLILSLVFYAWWNPWFLTLIGISAIVDFLVAPKIHASTDKRRRLSWLLVSLGINLGILAVFKYTPFVLENASDIAQSFGHDVKWSIPGWIIPVGISFYTFQTLSYSLDIYRGNLEPVRSFRDFFLYVSFFPQLVAGPIVRASELLPQLKERRTLLPVSVQVGLYFVIQGLFFKVVISDNVELPIAQAFKLDGLDSLSPTAAWLGSIYFTTQVFGDFAGYSGIAIGLAYLMGLRFPLNFNYPYISTSLAEYWTRWHISLSRWLRDYLYISLGGNRKGAARAYVNIFLTFLLSGLWHGAAWSYVAWGAMHGFGLCIERMLRKGAPTKAVSRVQGSSELVKRLLLVGVVMMFANISHVFIRAQDFTLAWGYLQRMFVAPFSEPLGLEALGEARYLVFVIPIVVLHLAQLAHDWYGFKKTAWRRALVAAVMLFCLLLFRREVAPDFIYFQF